MAEEWYVGRNGQQSGPFSAEELRRMAASGGLSKTDLVWREGFANWVPCSTVKELYPAAGNLPPATPSRPAPRRVAPPPRTPPASATGGNAPIAAGTADSAFTGSMPPEAMVFNGGSGMASGFPPLALADYLPRVGAALLDALFLLLIGCIPNVVLAALLFAATANNPDGAQIAAALFNTCSSVIGFVIGAVYYVGLEASAKQGTWGKQIVGLKVTDLEGRRIGVGRAIGRLFARYISICTCGIGYLLPLFTKNRQTLHDLICGCVVLNK